ncbi:MAG TPA: DUF1449 family protein [Pirellulaceae bacterium]|nr:DUF1449 family protein [Pirellulaceae bacterium]
MVTLFFEMLQPINLVPTILLLLAAAYWVLVFIGVVADDWFDIDFDGAEGSTPWMGAFKFLHFGDVPAMIVVSLFIVFFWASTIISNHYFNPTLSVWVVAFLLIPNIVVSILVTKGLLFPTVKLFAKLSPPQSHDKANFVGRLAVVNTSEISEEFGQIAIQHDGPPIVFNARCFGSRPRKGDVVEIVEYQPVTDTFVVRLSKRMG